MTEKRYDIEYDSNCYMCIVDCEKKVLYTDRKKIVKLLNEQNETITRLKNQVDYLDKSILTERSQIVKLQRENERLVKMLDNGANYVQREHREMPLDDFVEWWNNIVTEGLDD